MTVVIAIDYVSLEFDSKVLQRGAFQIIGKKTRGSSSQFFRQIHKELSRTLVIEKVLCDGENISELVGERL